MHPLDDSRNAPHTDVGDGGKHALACRRNPSSNEAGDTPHHTGIANGSLEPGQEVEKRAKIRTDAELAAERRSERQFVRVQLPIEVAHRGAAYPGVDISLTGFSCVGSPAIEDDIVDSFVLHLLFHGYRLSIAVKAQRVRQIDTQDLSAFQIVEIDDAQTEVLRKVLRAHLSGQLITVDGVLASSDSQTARQAARTAGDTANGTLSGKALWRRRVWLCGIAFGTCALVVVLLASLFERFAVVESTFAAITAPRLDIRAPADGEVRAHDIRPGDWLMRDQPLTQILDRHLDADLELARARLVVAQQLLNSAVTRQGNALLSTLLDRRLSVRPQSISLQASAGLEQAELNALELRAQANHLYTPCACSVSWAAPTGTWVEKGELLFTLIRTESRELRIEALVPLHAIDRITQDQVAFIMLPNASQLFEARVEHITMDPLRQPRTGLPRWLREDRSQASVLLHLDHTLPSNLIGRPLQVVFSDWPGVTIAMADLRTESVKLGPKALQVLGKAQFVAKVIVQATIENYGRLLAGTSR
ncbi:MAG: hypothetical protein ACR2Q4_09280 [Geminicoccaceae bacterium]